MNPAALFGGGAASGLLCDYENFQKLECMTGKTTCNASREVLRELGFKHEFWLKFPAVVDLTKALDTNLSFSSPWTAFYVSASNHAVLMLSSDIDAVAFKLTVG